MFKTTTAIRKLLKLNKPLRVIQGGSSASKTYGILAILIDKAAKQPRTEISVVSESIPHLRRGCIRDFKKIMQSTGRWRDERFNRSLLTYTFSNGSTIEFFSADSESKVRGSRRQVLYVNEANNIGFDAFYALRIRTSDLVIIDFNPVAEFWAHEEFRNDPQADWLILTYKDNEAAPEQAVIELEKAKQKGEAGSKFWANYYRVYGMGLPGILVGAVFQNWQEGPFKEVGPIVYGQDFGFASDSSTLVKTSIDKKNKIIYLEECFYKPGLTTSDLRRLNEQYAGDYPIIMDSAESRLIHELSLTLNAHKSIKGPDSINYGIMLMQDYELVVSGANLIKELRGYMWLAKGIPKGQHGDHILDAARYAITYQLANPNRGNYNIL